MEAIIFILTTLILLLMTSTLVDSNKSKYNIVTIEKIVDEEFKMRANKEAFSEIKNNFKHIEDYNSTANKKSVIKDFIKLNEVLEKEKFNDEHEMIRLEFIKNIEENKDNIYFL